MFLSSDISIVVITVSLLGLFSEEDDCTDEDPADDAEELLVVELSEFEAEVLPLFSVFELLFLLSELLLSSVFVEFAVPDVVFEVLFLLDEEVVLLFLFDVPDELLFVFELDELDELDELLDELFFDELELDEFLSELELSEESELFFELPDELVLYLSILAFNTSTSSLRSWFSFLRSSI